MVKDSVGTCFVVDSDGNYKGVINTRDIVKKVLRG
jgi:predicted transcriptional regulator